MGYKPSPLDNWISQRQYMHTQTIKNLHRFSSSQKGPHTITKINDNIDMDSTISESMNARSLLTTS